MLIYVEQQIISLNFLLLSGSGTIIIIIIIKQISFLVSVSADINRMKKIPPKSNYAKCPYSHELMTALAYQSYLLYMQYCIDLAKCSMVLFFKRLLPFNLCGVIITILYVRYILTSVES